MTALLAGVLAGWVAGEAYRALADLPFTRTVEDLAHSRIKATRFHTVVTEGIHFRGRSPSGRLYALEVWREHAH